MPHKPDHYHQTSPPCELKSVVLGRQNSKKSQKQSDSEAGEGSDASTCSPSWTNDTPTETGWYWMRGGDSYGWHEACVEVDLQSNDHAEYYYDGEWVTEDKLPPNLEWSNKPISEPKDNDQIQPRHD